MRKRNQKKLKNPRYGIRLE